ncbi:hypothetical protein BBP40_009977 [Aspergillus hancockii]|nr:hypothetical protein BBP40_009977 [Aspergillus hancockii]
MRMQLQVVARRNSGEGVLIANNLGISIIVQHSYCYWGLSERNPHAFGRFQLGYRDYLTGVPWNRARAWEKLGSAGDHRKGWSICLVFKGEWQALEVLFQTRRAYRSMVAVRQSYLSLGPGEHSRRPKYIPSSEAIVMDSSSFGFGPLVDSNGGRRETERRNYPRPLRMMIGIVFGGVGRGGDTRGQTYLCGRIVSLMDIMHSVPHMTGMPSANEAGAILPHVAAMLLAVCRLMVWKRVMISGLRTQFRQENLMDQ